jgi:hypothetical protein
MMISSHTMVLVRYCRIKCLPTEKNIRILLPCANPNQEIIILYCVNLTSSRGIRTSLPSQPNWRF